jgi:hypothetical protein
MSQDTPAIKGRSVKAIALPLRSGGEAILVQDGPPWEIVRKFKCIAPDALAGQFVLAMPEKSSLQTLIGRAFDVDGAGDIWLVFATSTAIGAQLAVNEEKPAP